MSRGWLRSWYRNLFNTYAPPRFPRSPRARLQVELVENRNLPSGASTPVGAGALSTRLTPYSVAVADVSGAGKPDLITANAYSGYTGGTVSVLLGNGDGTFKAA